MRERAIIAIVTTPTDLLVALACDALSAAEVDEGPPHMSAGAVLVFCDYAQETGWRDWRVAHLSGWEIQRRWESWWTKQTVAPSAAWLRGGVAVLLFEDWSKERWPIKRIETKLYAASYVVMNGRLLTEECSVSVRPPARGQRIENIAGRYLGTSAPSPEVRISVSDAVPADADVFETLRDAFRGPVTIEVAVEGRPPVRAVGFIGESAINGGGLAPPTFGFEFSGVPEQRAGIAQVDRVPGAYLEIDYGTIPSPLTSSERAPAPRRRRG